jgi:Caspase domain
MPSRALIIAIQCYSDVSDGSVARCLPGTLQAALDFKAWLLRKWTAENTTETQIIFCSNPKQPEGRGATKKDLLQALLDLKKEGQNATSELFVFFSGHGFSFVGTGKRADIIMASDFQSAELSGSCCLNLDEINLWLRQHLGAGRHYYFVDACRNPLNASQIQPGDVPPFNPQASGDPSTYILQSTVDGAVAAVDGEFPAALLAGLRGSGKAKTWDEDHDDVMFVRFDSLRSYLNQSLQQKIHGKVDGKDGERDAVFATLRPVPLSKCVIVVHDAPEPVSGTITYRGRRNAATVEKKLTTVETELNLPPDRYTFQLQIDGSGVKSLARTEVSLYEDQRIEFRRVNFQAGTEPQETRAGTRKGLASVVVPPGSSVELRDMESDRTVEFDRETQGVVPKGRYAGVLRDRERRIIKRADVDVEDEAVIDIANWQNSAPHVAIANYLPHYGNSVFFSNSLGGPVDDPDLNIWLAIAGAGRILGSHGDYSKLSLLPLRDFSAVAPQISPIYVLAGFEEVTTKLRVGISSGPKVDWLIASEPPNMRGIREAYFASDPGPQLVSFEIENTPVYSVATFATPNRATLVTLTLDEEDAPQISQYLLPIGHLLRHMPKFVRRTLTRRNQLLDARYIAQAGRAFRRRRDIWQQLPEYALRDLMYSKWLDPIACSLAAYEKLRRGELQDLHEVVGNMTSYFPDLPDSAALAVLAGHGAKFNGVPLFLDGLRAFPRELETLPLPRQNLDFNSPWTAWREAVYR